MTAMQCTDALRARQLVIEAAASAELESEREQQRARISSMLDVVNAADTGAIALMRVVNTRCVW